MLFKDLKVGLDVEVVQITDSTADPEVYVGQIGKIIEVLPYMACCDSERDPMIDVSFPDRPPYAFWLEELKIVEK